MSRSAVVIASPPPAAVGGVATYTGILLAAMPEAALFDEWWPRTSRSNRAIARLAVHALGLARWSARLAIAPPMIVHLQVTSPGIRRDLAYARIADRLGVPVVAHVHTSGFTGEGAGAAAVEGLRVMAGLARGFIVMSQSAADALEERVPEVRGKVFVVPNPAALAAPAREAPAFAPTRCRLLCIGELSDAKGQAGLVRAAELLVGGGRDVRVELVGPWGAMDPADRAHLESSQIVDLPGVLRGGDLTRAYLRADGFALFSRTEAEPMAMLEAMLAGLPVVATAVGSIPSTLSAVGATPGDDIASDEDEPAESGANLNAIVSPGDVAALADALSRLESDPAGRAATGAVNRRWASTHRSVAAHVSALRAVYGRLTRDGQDGSAERVSRTGAVG